MVRCRADRREPGQISGIAVVRGPEGARSLLSTVASSMITVTGTVFSITIARGSYVCQLAIRPAAAAQFHPGRTPSAVPRRTHATTAAARRPGQFAAPTTAARSVRSIPASRWPIEAARKAWSAGDFLSRFVMHRGIHPHPPFGEWRTPRPAIASAKSFARGRSSPMDGGPSPAQTIARTTHLPHAMTSLYSRM